MPAGNREDMERLAQYIIRNAFSVEKMRPDGSGDSIIYRYGINPKIGRNFEVFSPCDFIVRITPSISWTRASNSSATTGGNRTRCAAIASRVRSPNPPGRSSNPGSPIRSSTTTTNRCLQRTEDPGTAEVRS